MEIENEQENEEVVNDSISDSIGDAWDASESTDETMVSDVIGGEAPAEPDAFQEAAPDAESGDLAGGDTGTGAKDFAPKSLSPGAREAWRATPKAMQDEIAKRERDYEAGIVKYADNAKRAEGMDRVLQPYSQYLEMNGGAGNTVQNLLQTGAALQFGSPSQKAEMISNLINQFGVDIKTLDNMLVGQAPPPEVQQQNQVQQQIQQAIAPYQQHLLQMQQAQQYQEQQGQQAISGEINTFASNNEFYGDVKMQMADILDLAANRGQQMDLNEAYNMACQLNPEIAKIRQSRELSQNTQQRKRAASSIHGSPGGPGGSSTPGSTRSAIEDAWDTAGRA